MNGKSCEEKRNAATTIRKDDRPGIRGTTIRSACLIVVALFVAAWCPGAFAAAPGSPASSADKEGQSAGKIGGGEFKKYRAVFSELVCGDVKALAVRIAPEDDEWILHAIDQRIYLIDKAGNAVLLRDSWDYDILHPKGKIRKSHGAIYVATSWGCVKDKRGKFYLLVNYMDGGNHTGSEWTEIYDLKGNMVASEFTMRVRDVERKRHLFNKKVEKLGISYDWRTISENWIEELKAR